MAFDRWLSYAGMSVNPPFTSGSLCPELKNIILFLTAKANRLLEWLTLSGRVAHFGAEYATSDTFRSQLPKRRTMSLLFTHSYENIPWSVSFGGTHYKQGLHSIFQTGFMITENEIDMSFGLWYRGTTNKLDMQTLGITVIYNFSGRANERNVVKTGVAHDMQMGNNTYSYTAGSSEMGFVWDVKTYDYDNDHSSKPRISPYKCPAISQQW